MLQFKGLQRVGHNVATEQKQFCPYNKMFICLCSCPVIETGGIWIRLVGPSAGGKMKSRISIMQWNLLILERGKPRGREERKQRTQWAVGHGWGGERGGRPENWEPGGRGCLEHREGRAERQRGRGTMIAETEREGLKAPNLGSLKPFWSLLIHRAVFLVHN